jgi:hypothetical protein
MNKRGLKRGENDRGTGRGDYGLGSRPPVFRLCVNRCLWVSLDAIGKIISDMLLVVCHVRLVSIRISAKVENSATRRLFSIHRILCPQFL